MASGDLSIKVRSRRSVEKRRFVLTVQQEFAFTADSVRKCSIYKQKILFVYKLEGTE